MTDLSQFKDQHYLSLETFRKTGIGVKTPIWFVQEGDVLYLWTRGDSGKAKRIRNNAQVNIAPCKQMGEVTGQWIPAHATVDNSAAAVEHVTAMLRKKMGLSFLIFGTIEKIMEKLQGHERVSIKLSFSENSLATVQFQKS